MTRDDIIRMAREAGGLIHEVDWCFEAENLERFAALAYAAGAADMKERCAKVAEFVLKMPKNDVSTYIRSLGDDE